MRIMLTVLGEQGDRDVVVEVDDGVTVARVAEALGGHEPLAKVVRLPRARAPYGMSGDPGHRRPYAAADSGGPGGRSPFERRATDGGVHEQSVQRGRAAERDIQDELLRGFPAGHAPERGVADTRDPERGDPDGADGLGLDGPTLWRDGRRLDPRALARAVLREGDRVTLDARLSRATVVEEPVGVVELRVVGGPGAGAVHRLSLGSHVIGSDPGCAIAVRDPALAPEAAVLRVTPAAVTVEPVRRERPSGEPQRKIKGRYAEELTELAARDEERAADRWAEAEQARYLASAERHERSVGWGGGPALSGSPLTEAAEWPEHALLTCGSSVFALTAIEPQDAHLAPAAEGGVAYNRPPRLRRVEPERRFERPKEPRRGEGMRLQLLAAFLPAALGLVLVLVLRQWYFLLIALMTPLIMIGQWWSDRRHGRKQHRQAIKEFRERLEEHEQAVERARAADELARRADAPDPAEVLLTATGPRRRLWERRIHDPDALRLRVGLADLPADLELVEEQGGPLDPPICHAVPVALAMRRLGVAGVTGPREEATGLAGWLIGQAAALHSPRDLAIVVLSAHPDAERRWSWVRWLPHCAPRGGEDCLALVGTDPDSAARRVAELAALIDERQNTAIPELGKIPTGWDDLGGPEPPAFTTYDQRPYDVLVFLDGAQALRGLPGMPQVLRQGPRAGVYTLALDEDQRLLPEECATVAACDGSLLRLRGGGLDVLGPVLADQVSAAWSDRLARALAPIRDVSRDDPAGHLPEAVRLLDLLGHRSPSGPELAAGWRAIGSTRAVIGVGPDGPFSVDLRLDGPHGLIAGTTGAGKSELLQTLIGSLAVANRPDQLSFVLIDYKGGAAFKECVRLPHTVGMVSDLDGHLTRRALDSLGAEIRRRERLLLAAGAKDIDDYTERVTAHPTTPSSALATSWASVSDTGGAADGGLPALPRLVLIIDEFAALVAELPDFVTGLVDIARRGRSLGIHLILATQRPAGVVTADIQANTSLRIALRVTEPVESTDVIDLPDAAHIAKSVPGRCYVKSGAGAATAVQTARVGGRSGAPDRGQRRVRVVDVGWRSVGRPLPPEPESTETAAVTDLTLLADTLIEAAGLAGVPAQPSPWLDPLPTGVLLPAGDQRPGLLGHRRRASRSEWPAEVAPLEFGITDRPWAQDRRALTLDLAHGGHLLIAGTSRSGRSTALRTIAGAIAAETCPADVHVHAIDCGSGALLPLVAMPHCGAVVTRDQLDRVERLLTRLRAEVGRRQQLLAEAGHASLAEYRSAGHRLPWLVLMIDRWEGYVAAFEGYDYGRLTEALLQLLREGPAVGLRAVVTGDRSCLLGQVSTVFDDRLLLRLADPADYGLAGLPIKDLPATMPPGRALTTGEHGIVESQIALLSPDPTGQAQVAALQALTRAISAEAGALSAVRVGSGGVAVGGSSGVTASGAEAGSERSSGVEADGSVAAGPVGSTPGHASHISAEPLIAGASGTGGMEPPPSEPSTRGTSAASEPRTPEAPATGRQEKTHPEPAGTRSPGPGSTEPANPDWPWPGEPPLRVDVLPTRLTTAQALALRPDFVCPSPLWALVGAGGDSLSPMGIDLLAQGPGAIIAGPARSGRSSALMTAASSLIAQGTPVIAVVPRRSPLRELRGALAILDGNGTGLQDLTAGRDRYVVVVDDAELINPDAPLGQALEDILRTGRDGDHALLLAGSTGDLATSYRGFVAETRKSRTGVLLAVQSPADGDLFTVRLPRGAVGGPPGRGLLITTGTVQPVQAALP